MVATDKLHRRTRLTALDDHATDEFQQRIEPQTDDSTEEYSFRWYNAGLLFYSIFTYLVDVVWDIIVAAGLYSTGQMWYFGLTVVFIVVPAVIMMFFSMKWYIEDSKKEGPPKYTTLGWAVRVVFHLLLLGPVVRYIDTLIYGIKHHLLQKEGRDDERTREEKEKYHIWLKYEEADAGYLRLFEAFMEAAPQTILQLYILVQPDSRDSFTDMIKRIISICFSMISLSTGLVAQQRSMRLSQALAKTPTYIASFVQFCWYLFMNISRMFSVGLFNSLHPKYMAVIFSVRWFIATVWLLRRKTFLFDSDTEEDGSEKKKAKLSYVAEFVYKCALGVVFLFAYVNPLTGRTRWRYTIYYLTIFIENAALISVWYVSVEDQVWYRLPAILSVYLSFFLGICFMLIYYLELHPTGAIEVWPEKEEMEVQEPLESTLDITANTHVEQNSFGSSGSINHKKESVSLNSVSPIHQRRNSSTEVHPETYV